MVKVTPAILDRLHGPGRTAAIQIEARRHVRGGVPQSPEKFKGGESVKPKRRFPAPSRLYKVQDTLRLSVLHQDVREIIVPEVVPSHDDAAGCRGIRTPAGDPHCSSTGPQRHYPGCRCKSYSIILRRIWPKEWKVRSACRPRLPGRFVWSSSVMRRSRLCGLRRTRRRGPSQVR